tara:strand:+ start:147 stop:1031 length:885 start_codon:yes stop_codon:yes gene_type:complete
MAVKPGIYAASMSIFNEDLSLNVDFTIGHAERVVKDGCHGVVLLGSTGIAQYISSKEKKKLIDKAGTSKCRDNFIIGTGSNSLLENVDLIKHSLSNGINRFLLMTPAYYSYQDDGVYRYYSNIIEKVPEVSIILYNYLKLCGYKFSVQVIERLVKDFPKQIIGVKDSTYNLFDVLKIPNFLIFPGSERKLLQGLQLGNSGIISAICNVTAQLSRKVYDDFHNKKEQKFNEKLCSIRKVFDNYNLISGLHTFMSVENEKYKRILPPMSLLSNVEQKELMSKLKELEFFPEKNIAA